MSARRQLASMAARKAEVAKAQQLEVMMILWQQDKFLSQD